MTKSILVVTVLIAILTVTIIASSCSTLQAPSNGESEARMPLISEGSSSQAPIPDEQYPGDHGITTTKVMPEPGDQTTSVNAQWPPLTLNDLVAESDAIVIGKVVDILPAKQTQDANNSDKPIIYTDVVIEITRYLFGGVQSSHLALRVKGGRIGTTVFIDTNAPVLNLGDEVVLLLMSPSEDLTPPEGIRTENYYKVVAGMLGMGEYENGSMIRQGGDQFSISSILQAVDLMHKTE